MTCVTKSYLFRRQFATLRMGAIDVRLLCPWNDGRYYNHHLSRNTSGLFRLAMYSCTASRQGRSVFAESLASVSGSSPRKTVAGSVVMLRFN